MVRKLIDARKLLAEERFGEAIRNLGGILEAREDSFLPARQNVSGTSQLEGRGAAADGRTAAAKAAKLYELQYGAQAGKMLEEALAADNPERLAEVSRRFFCTQSGAQATLLLGLYHLSHGQPLAGALALRRLGEAGQSADEFEPALSLSLAACWLRAGATDEARRVLVELRKRDPTRRVTIAGRDVPLFADDRERYEWLQGLIGQQQAAAGLSQRDAASAGGAPLAGARWRVPIADDPYFEAAVEQYQRLLKEHEGGAAIPTLHPLPVGNVLLMRTLRKLLAVDLADWQAVVGGPVGCQQRLSKPQPAAKIR